MRSAEVKRETKETNIKLSIELDGTGKCAADTGIGFFDHMLSSFAKHGFFDIELSVAGDLNVDSHHTIEDVGIVLGLAIKEALGDKISIKRFGSAILPMDETLVLCAVDLSGRPYYVSDIEFGKERIGCFDTEMFEEFFRAVSYAAGINLHFKMFYGSNDHHIAECAFKAFAKALDCACGLDERITSVLSTKGVM